MLPLQLTDQEREVVGFVLVDAVMDMCRAATQLPNSDPNRARTIINASVLNDVLSKLTVSQSITLTGDRP